MMSRSLGQGDYERVRSSSAFGFYGALFSGLLFSLLCTVFSSPLLNLLGADATTREATYNYMFWTVCCGAMPAILNAVQGYMVRSEGSALHASIGGMSGCILNIILDPFFILPWGLNMGAAGAGLATFVSNCMACLYFLILAWVKKEKTFVCMDIRRLKKLPPGVVKGILGVGIPASIQNLLNVTGSTILNNLDMLDPDKLEMVPSGGVILSKTTVTFYEGESVFDVLQRVCKEKGIHMEAAWTPIYNSAYVEGIHNLYEFDCGALSGWMYKVNGWYPNYGSSRYQLKDGDTVEWRFTCDLGNDIGGGYAVGG
jgi:hypothetical protein